LKECNDEKNSLIIPLDGPSRGRGGKRALECPKWIRL